ncbi:hypothetical protein BTJ39_09285 [Izhakiella australiensis]|uniref:Glycine-rich domain-containing protein n=1 Tax=Izhakiella australiensis TaxID=1926881 RepID=A0A1S8YPK6_9GAMM|nr:hypothetical protein BTJ39_09285 [Izhakiella australiensis]
MGEKTVMAKNDFKAFATDANANVTTQADYEELAALLTGFQSGKASSAQINKALRQASFIAAALAQYTADKSGQDVIDDGDVAAFIAKMSSAFGKDYQPLAATLTAISGLATGADTLAYFTGAKTAGQTSLTQTGRDIVGQASVANVLSYLGLVDGNGSTGRKINEQWITTSKTYTPTSGTKRIKVTITGGGGGGGGAFNSGGSTDNFSGAGGAAGATGIKWLNIADITNFAVVVGAGGSEATKGGDSTFSGIVATGGAPSVAATVFASGGTGGAGTGGDINISGGDGGDGQNGTRLLNGMGGASIWGGSRRSGQGSVSVPTIPKASVYGGGGGGAYDTQTMSTRFYGGTGANGICLIEEFA